MKPDLYSPAFQREFFNAFARTYRYVNFVFAGLQKNVCRRALGQVAIPKEAVVCDLMCGDGINVRLLQRYDCRHIYAVDLSEKMLQRAKAECPYPNVTFLHENALFTSIPSGTVDVVTCTFGLKTLSTTQQQLLLDEVKRLLRPGGTFLLAELSKPGRQPSRTFFYLFCRFLLDGTGLLLRYPFIRKKYLWTYVRAFGSGKSLAEYSSQSGDRVRLFDWYGGMITGLTGEKGSRGPVAGQ